MLKLGRLVREEKINYEQEQAVDQVMGAVFMIRGKLLEEVGLLDEGYWLWFEEVDYCRRAKEQGWQVWYAPQGECVHYGGVSFGQLVGFRKTWPWLRSMHRYAKKHMGWETRLLIYLLSPVYVVLSLLAILGHVTADNTEQPSPSAS